MKKAFTLAETLITLAVIGVVAAISIPGLITKLNENQYKTMWKKKYSELANAYNLVIQEEGGVDGYFTPLEDGYVSDEADISRPIINKIISKMSHIQKCPNGICSDGTNIQTIYKTINDRTIVSSNFNNCSTYYELIDGTSVLCRTWNSNAALIWIDVNSYKKGPNKLGIDLFGAVVSGNGIKPMGATDIGNHYNCEKTNVTCDPNPDPGWHNSPCEGAGCSAQYLYDK